MTTPQTNPSSRAVSPTTADESGVRESLAEIGATLGAFVGRGRALRQRSKDIIEESRRRHERDNLKTAG